MKQTLKEGGYADTWISYLLDQRPQMEIKLPLLTHCPRINAAPNQMKKEKELGTTQGTTSSGQLLFDLSQKKTAKSSKFKHLSVFHDVLK